MFSMHTTLMDSDEAYQALLGLILADEPSSHDGMTWDRIALSFTVASPNQRHINYLIEAASNQLLGQLTDTLCRMFMLNPNDMATLANGAFQAYAAAIAALPQRVVDLRALRGAEFCEVLRRMVEERHTAMDPLRRPQQPTLSPQYQRLINLINERPNTNTDSDWDDIRVLRFSTEELEFATDYALNVYTQWLMEDLRLLWPLLGVRRQERDES
ncbi:hypothetical protein MBLNU13_g06832t1 [Cladosporium sp. NU13]